MPVSGLVITRARDVDAVALDAHLRAVEGLELGPSSEARLAATLATDDAARHDAALAAIGAIPGVLLVELAFHDMSDVECVAHPPTRERTRSDARTSRGDSHGPT